MTAALEGIRVLVVEDEFLVAALIEECKPWFQDLRGETRVRLGRSLC